jgi:hypothetical protein
VKFRVGFTVIIIKTGKKIKIGAERGIVERLPYIVIGTGGKRNNFP